MILSQFLVQRFFEYKSMLSQFWRLQVRNRMPATNMVCVYCYGRDQLYLPALQVMPLLMANRNKVGHDGSFFSVISSSFL